MPRGVIHRVLRLGDDLGDDRGATVVIVQHSKRRSSVHVHPRILNMRQAHVVAELNDEGEHPAVVRFVGPRAVRGASNHLVGQRSVVRGRVGGLRHRFNVLSHNVGQRDVGPAHAILEVGLQEDHGLEPIVVVDRRPLRRRRRFGLVLHQLAHQPDVGLGDVPGNNGSGDTSLELGPENEQDEVRLSSEGDIEARIRDLDVVGTVDRPPPDDGAFGTLSPPRWGSSPGSLASS